MTSGYYEFYHICLSFMFLDSYQINTDGKWHVQERNKGFAEKSAYTDQVAEKKMITFIHTTKKRNAETREKIHNIRYLFR